MDKSGKSAKEEKVEKGKQIEKDVGKKLSLEQGACEAEKSNEIRAFIRSYQLKQTAIKELLLIYSRHITSQHFSSTFKAAVAMLTLPSLTNIYYSIRSHSMLAGVMPIAVPIVCLANYIYTLNRDMQAFSLTDLPDAQLARSQYDIIYEFSYYDRFNQSFMRKLQNFRQDPTRKQQQEQL